MNKPDKFRPLLTLPETAEYLKLSVNTVRRIIPELNGYKVRGQRRFSMTEIQKYLASQSAAGRSKVRRLK